MCLVRAVLALGSNLPWLFSQKGNAMMTSKRFMLGTLLVAATTWVAGPSLAASNSSHSVSPATNASGSAPPPSGPKPQAVLPAGKTKGVKPIKFAPATYKNVPTGIQSNSPLPQGPQNAIGPGSNTTPGGTPY